MSADTVVQIWKDYELVNSFKRWYEYIAPIAKQNYKMVLSACWYLNHDQDWKEYYQCDPHDFSGFITSFLTAAILKILFWFYLGTTQEKDLVIGGKIKSISQYFIGTNINQYLIYR